MWGHRRHRCRPLGVLANCVFQIVYYVSLTTPRSCPYKYAKPARFGYKEDKVAREIPVRTWGIFAVARLRASSGLTAEVCCGRCHVVTMRIHLRV